LWTKARHLKLKYSDLIYFTECSVNSFNQTIMRSNTYYELVFFRHAWENGVLYFDGGQHILQSGEIILLPPYTKYRFVCEGKNEGIFLGFDDCGYRFSKAPFIVQDGGQKNLIKLLNLMTEEFSGQHYRRKKMMNVLLNALTVSLARYAQPYDDKKELETVNFEFILQFMQAHSHNGFDIEEFAKMSGLSYHRFRHKFKELTNISPQQYIIRQRLSFAKRLLETTEYSTSSIAIACGFHSIPQFITCFSKQEGMTPVKYRKLAGYTASFTGGLSSCTGGSSHT
jgi:AraC-like DNA-binding protein